MKIKFEYAYNNYEVDFDADNIATTLSAIRRIVEDYSYPIKFYNTPPDILLEYLDNNGYEMEVL